MTARNAEKPWVMAPEGAELTMERTAPAPTQFPFSAMLSAALNMIPQGVAVDVCVMVAVGVIVEVGLAVGVELEVEVTVELGLAVAVQVEVEVWLGVWLDVGDQVRVGDQVGVGLLVGVGVLVGVGQSCSRRILSRYTGKLPEKPQSVMKANSIFDRMLAGPTRAATGKSRFRTTWLAPSAKTGSEAAIFARLRPDTPKSRRR